MIQTKYVSASELADILGCSISHSYKLIKLLNAQLREQGYIVLAGKVPMKYIAEKLYL